MPDLESTGELQAEDRSGFNKDRRDKDVGKWINSKSSGGTIKTYE